jgi:tRNA-binding protein
LAHHRRPRCADVQARRIIRDPAGSPEEAQTQSRPALLPAGSATIEDLGRLDLRIGRVVDAAPLEGARRPAYRLRIDLGAGDIRGSSAQLVRSYPDPLMLVGRLVVTVVNLPVRRVAGFASEVLVLGALGGDDEVYLRGVDGPAELGQRVAIGAMECPPAGGSGPRTRVVGRLTDTPREYAASALQGAETRC